VAACLALLTACAMQPCPEPQYAAWQEGECPEGLLHVDTPDHHRCVQYLLARCERGVGRVEGPATMCVEPVDLRGACPSGCPCGLTDMGPDADGWTRCGSVVEGWYRGEPEGGVCE
jgi:hypothetical protein